MVHRHNGDLSYLHVYIYGQCGQKVSVVHSHNEDLSYLHVYTYVYGVRGFRVLLLQRHFRVMSSLFRCGAATIA